MDVILGTFARDFLPTASEDDVTAYEALLTENDPDLYNWISGREPVPADNDNPILKKLVGYRVNSN